VCERCQVNQYPKLYLRERSSALAAESHESFLARLGYMLDCVPFIPSETLDEMCDMRYPHEKAPRRTLASVAVNPIAATADWFGWLIFGAILLTALAFWCYWIASMHTGGAQVFFSILTLPILGVIDLFISDWF
jgi:hypothetical protein